MPSWRVAFRMAVPPALIALAVTLLRLAGERLGWSEAWFSRATSGLVPAGAVSWLVGITWLALPFGAWLAWRLLRSGAAPTFRGAEHRRYREAATVEATRTAIGRWFAGRYPAAGQCLLGLLLVGVGQ